MSQNQITEEYVMYGMTVAGVAFFGGIFMPDAETFFLINGIAWVVAILIFYTGYQKQKEFDNRLERAEKRRIRTATERKRQQKQRQKEQDKLRRRRAAEQRVKDLDNAKRLAEEGGIENLNKAIGIFEKYE